MSVLRISTIACGALALLLAAACGGGAQPSATAPGQVATSPPPTAPPAASPIAVPSKTAQPPAATIASAQGEVNLPPSNQPGSTIAGTSVEQMVFGREYDETRPEILQLAWTFPLDANKIYFGFAINNGPQQFDFTQTLKLNGQEIPLPLKPFSVPPSSPGKKQFRARGLSVKPGNTLPVGRYEILVYSEGNLLQKGIFDVKQPVGTSALDVGRGLDFGRYSDAAGIVQQIDPDIFELTEEWIETVDDDFLYYEEDELEQAYEDLEHVDEEYEPFPDDILLEIEEEFAAFCEEIGGIYDGDSGTCHVDDVGSACEALGGILYDDTCYFDENEVPLSPEQLDCEAIGWTWDPDTETCNPPPDPQAECEAQGGIWDPDTQTCNPPPDSQAECEAQGGIWDPDTQTCNPPPDPQAECEALGWIWDPDTQTCSPPPASQAECEAIGWIWDPDTETCGPPPAPAP